MRIRAARARSLALANLLLIASLVLVPPLAAAGEAGAAARRGLAIARSAAGYPPDQLTPLGALALPGYNADVWAHNGYAYVGTWGTAASYPARCPATGVRIVSLADPTNPTRVGTVAAIVGTSQEDMVVKHIATPDFTGDLLVTGIQACDRTTSAPRGIDLWDVSDPRKPMHLNFWSSGPNGPAGARGVHELYLFQRGDRAYVAAAVPSSEDIEGVGDFRLVDVTDPRHPTQVSAWGARRDGGLRPASGQSFFDHSAWTNAAGTLAVLSYWDAGVIFLDISDPAAPRMVGRAAYPPGSPGDTHSVWFTPDEQTLLVADETLDTSQGYWGYLRIFDIRDPAHPVQIGKYATPNSATTRRDGDYSIHNPFVVGDRAFLSWYTDGIRVLDIADPTRPREVASFVPPAAADPYRTFTNTAQVWGVCVYGDLVLASDINAGLFVLRDER
jgi:choice-of-anchor B domain-containing protein